MRSLSLVFRWSWRDLRAHWAKVLAIALVIAIGTGGYAGLTSNANWRRASYEASFETLGMYDLRVDLAAGNHVAEGSLQEMIASIEHARWVDVAEERLIVPTLLDASQGSDAVLVRSEITGSDLSEGGPHVNGYHVFEGTDLREAPDGSVLLERNFAKHHDLPATGTVAISGGREVAFAGHASTPEYFTVAPEGDIFLSEASFGAVFTSLATAQDLADRPGQVNNAVLSLTADADRQVVRLELDAALSDAGIGAEVATRDDDVAYATLTTDVENDQQVFNLLAFLLFAGAVGAAFNLIHRLAEQQRREIGISMALGVPARRIALRPLLVSAQIALLGVVFGIGVGLLIGAGMQAVLEDFVPLPIWDTSFQVGVFAIASSIGFLLPFVATAFPIARAVRVTPVEAIRPPHLVSKRGADRGRRSFRGNTFRVMPLRNLLRAKRRTLLTSLGIAAIVTVLVAFLGMMDSFIGALDDAEAEAIGDAEHRITVALDDVHPVESSAVRDVLDASTVGVASPTLRLGATLSSTSDDFDVLVELIDLDDELWTPTIVAGTVGTGPGLILAEEAAGDLDVEVGDIVGMRHPRLTEAGSFELVDSDLPVLALHPYPIRTFAYMEGAHAELFGLAGMANLVQLDPATGSSADDVQRELFGVDAIVSVQPVTEATQAVRDQLGAVVGIMRVVAASVLVMALLIAFNTASINLDARMREHAAMFAYGVRVRSALRMAIEESAIVGILGTIVGVVAGLGMLTWMTQELLASTLPEFGMDAVLRPGTLVVIVLLGVFAVAIAPVFTVRRMRRMDLPGTLRLVE